MCPTCNGLKLLAKFMFKKCPPFALTRAQTGAPLSDCCISNMLVKFTVTICWERRYTVKAVHLVDNSGSTSCSIISCFGLEVFVQINRILTKFCLWKLGGFGNYDTPCIRKVWSCTAWHVWDVGYRRANTHCVIITCQLLIVVTLFKC